MNLIKQLRERTSAPIKEVKAALVDSNWDIEAAQKELRKRGIVLASKKSSRTASQGLGRIAGILSLEVDGVKTQADALQRIGSELAMHVVAAKPLFLTKELVSLDVLENEREILKSQAEASGKSQMAIDKMVEGRLRKYFEDVVLMDQKFVMNDTMKVKAVLDNLSKEVGSSVRIASFLRMEVGEGIARQETDASESVAMVA